MTTMSDVGALAFVFECRSEEWLEAEGLIRKRRHQRGEPEPVEGQETKPLQKPEPLEEVIPPYDSTLIERPRKIAKLSGNKGVSLGPKVKEESEDGLVNVKMEEGGSVPKIKEEVEEIKVSKLDGTQVRTNSAWPPFLC